MRLSKLRKWSFILLGALILTGCKPTSSSSSSSEVQAVMTISDVTIEVEQAAPLTIVFNPISAAGPVTYDIVDETVVRITDDYAIGLKEGVSSVTATSGTMSDTFTVTVTAKTVVIDPIEQFNEYGAITEGLPGFVLSGTNLEAHLVEEDADREGHTDALKFWVEGSPAIDFTLTSSYAAGTTFLSGDYTLSLELIGNPDEVMVVLEGETYSSVDDEVFIGSSRYEKSYFEFTLTRRKAISFSVQVKSAANQDTWGFLDNILLEKGHVAPDIIIPEEDGNLLLDGGFETVGKNANLDANDVWALNIAEGDAALTFWTQSNWPQTGKYALKFSYWPESGSKAIHASLTQNFNVTTAGDYVLSYFIATDGLPLSTFMIADSEGNTIESYPVGTAKSNPYAKRTMPTINLPAGNYQFKMIFAENSQTWAEIDEVKILPVAA